MPDIPARSDRPRPSGRLRPLCLAAGLALSQALPVAAQAPPFGDTAGTVFDIIRADDPTQFVCLEAAGRGARQIWDKRVNGEPIVEAHLFHARYADGTSIEMAINPEFDSAAARAQALRFATALGRLPTTLRRGIRRFGVHAGRQGFHAGTGGIIVYTGTADHREGYAHLEESLFHEAVHASWDAEHRLSPGWIAAQEADGRFLTDYARSRPDREDLAETALFAFAILYHPERFPPVDTRQTLEAVPHRIAYLRDLLPPEIPVTVPVGPPRGCAKGR
ncbi:hypothetical protein [Pseudoponticoccus marisrubri]|uniref:Uncharacterized protein n=1 Tax=Pseudoponticoccus marisrubri TaxID=1685382 RepID=A0A0W7WEB2_9RHOB|nr:hypothetical protein [Pseudoponticoccus marisrubri]KUF08977.1 hypothetical protein AVJ23_20015 [Pseudoponticoccus marisrubri]